MRKDKHPRLCRAMLTLAVSFALILTILVPHTLSAKFTGEHAAVAWSQPADDLGGVPDDAADFGVVQHASCSCVLIAVTEHAGPLMTVRPSLFAEFMPPADAPSRPRQAALPFKPPRV